MTGKRLTTWGIVTLATLMMAGAAEAQVIFANADTFVDSTNNNTNFGNGSLLRVRGASTQWYKTYIRFGLSSVPELDAGDTVTLSIGTSGANVWALKTFSVYGLKDGVGENWVEGNGNNSGVGGTDDTPVGELTWNNAPANDTASATGFTSDAILLGTFTVSTSSYTGYVDFSSTALRDFLAADTNDMATIMISSSVGAPTTVTSLDSRLAAGSPPKLTIAVPEPASVGTVLFAGASLLLGRRRVQR